jgi:hypothetical protein
MCKEMSVIPVNKVDKIRIIALRRRKRHTWLPPPQKKGIVL